MLNKIKSFLGRSKGAVLVGRPEEIQVITEMAGDYKCPYPEFYYIDVCNICNLSCPFCPTGLKRKGFSKSMMSPANYEIILEKIAPYAKQIHLYNWGEPFLNPDILSIIRMTSERGIFSIIHSNLSARDFTVGEAEDIARSGLSFLNVALDGASQESYEQYRRGGNFSRVLNNIRALQDAKKRLSVSLPIRWRFLINRYNEHELDTARALAKELGVILEFELMNLEDFLWDSSLHSKRDEDKWPKVEEYGDRVPQELAMHPNVPITLHKNIPSWCSQIFSWMNICPNGDVIPCSAVHGNRYVLGNLIGSSLEEIWQGENYLRCRQYLDNYGQKQETGSVCEITPCHLNKKYLEGIDGIAQADVLVNFVKGGWEEKNVKWMWLADKAEFLITPLRSGNLTLELIFPKVEIHKTVLPLETIIYKDDQIVKKYVFIEPGQNYVEIPVEENMQFALRVESDKYVIPDNVIHNKDTRMLSLILKSVEIA